MEPEPYSPAVHVLFAAVVCFGWLASRWIGRHPTAALRRIGLGGLAAGVFVAYWTVSEPQTSVEALFNDFYKAYYWGGAKILGEPRRIYHGLGHFTNAPIVALPFVPLARLDRGVAAWLWTALGAAGLAISWRWIRRLASIPPERTALLVSLFLVDGPLYYSVREGNLSHFTLPLLAGALVCRASRKDFAAGSLLGLATLLKPPLVLLCAYYLLRREWRVAIASGLVLAGLLAASLAVFGTELHERWYRECIAPFSASPLAAFNVQSIDAAFFRLVSRGGLRSYSPTAAGPSLRLFCRLVTGAIWLVVLRVLWRAGRPESAQQERLEFSIVLLLALTTSPLSWTHYYGCILIPAGLALGEGFPRPLEASRDRLFWIGVLLVSPVVVYIKVHTFVGRLLISHCLFGGLAMLAALVALRRPDEPAFEAKA